MSWLQKISTYLNKALSITRPPLKTLPAVLLLCESKRRPGLSAIALTSAILNRLSEAGIEIGPNVDGSPNKINQFVRIFSEEIVNELKMNAKISCAVAPMTINSIGNGANAGGPVVVTSANTTPLTIEGLLH